MIKSNIPRFVIKVIVNLSKPMGYTKAVRAAALPWNQRRERRAAASTSELELPAACLNSSARTPPPRFGRRTGNATLPFPDVRLGPAA